MSRKLYSPGRRPVHVRRAARGGTLLGIFVGLVLGLGIAAGVAYYLGRSGLTSPLPASAPGKDAARVGKAESGSPPAVADKPRFDFYKILPGAEEPKVAPERKSVDRATGDAGAKAPDAKTADAPTAKAADRAWLQAGAFTTQSDAENLKARLAMSGWEAIVQPASMPDKSTRYRVRMGPYDNADELNRIKNDLGKGGFDVAIIKNQ
jgi:cell division protein FtsN